MMFCRLIVIFSLLFLFGCQTQKINLSSDKFWEATSLAEVKSHFDTIPSFQGVKNDSIFTVAILAGVKDTNILAYLVKYQKGNVKLYSPKVKETLLMKALHQKVKSDVIAFLLNRGANVNATTKNGITPLMVCVRNYKCSTKVAQILLDRGAKLKAKDRFGRTAGYYATALNSNFEMFQFLQKKGINIHLVELYRGWNLFFAAVVNFQKPTYLKKLVEAGVSSQSVDIHGRTPIIEAVRNGYNVNYIQALMDLGVSVTRKTFQNQTALMYAFDQGNTTLIQFLLKQNLSLTDVDEKGRNAFDYARSEFLQSNVYKNLKKQNNL